MDSTNVVFIEQLPNILTKKQSKQLFTVYCYGLYLERLSKGPTSLFITDLTRNERIVNEKFPKDIDLCDGYTVEDNQVLRVDVFPENVNVFEGVYERSCSSNLTADLDSILDSNNRRLYIQEKVWLMRITISLKKYESTIEARMKAIEHIEHYDNHPNLLQLYRRFSGLSIEFLSSNKRALEKAIPAKHHQFVFSKGKSNLPEPSEASSEPDEITEDSIEYQPAQSKIKQEKVDDFIPDTLFPDDYENGELNQEIKESIHSQHEGRLVAQMRSQSTTSVKTLTELNSMVSSEKNNEIFTIEGSVVGVVPKDWSYTCVKTYSKSMISNDIELNDPEIREIELVVSNSDVSTNREVLLNAANSISVFINEEDIPDFFGLSEMERIYTHCCNKNNEFYNMNSFRKVKMKIYSKDKKINDNECIDVWYAKSVKFKDII